MSAPVCGMRMLDVARLCLRLGGLGALLFAVMDLPFLSHYLTRPLSPLAAAHIFRIALNLLVGFVLMAGTDRVLRLFLERESSAEDLKAIDVGVVVLRGFALLFFINALVGASYLPNSFRSYFAGKSPQPSWATMIEPIVYLLLGVVLYSKPGRMMWIFAPSHREPAASQA